MSTLVELTIFPVDKGVSVSQYVAGVVEIIKESGLNYRLGPMATVIEGDWPEIIKLVSLCMESLQEVSNRVYLVLKADYREGKGGRITEKVESVERILDMNKPSLK